MSRLPIEFLQHIKIEMTYLVKRSAGLTKADIFQHDDLSRAFARSLEIIGEATKQLPPSFRQSYPEIDWRGLAGLRDKLIHHYFGIDQDILWDVIANEIPPALDSLYLIIDNEINKSTV
jgi:uncharacterized protein with HEPN domain